MELALKDDVIYINYSGIGTVNLDLNDETNLSIAEQILKTIRTKLQKEKQTPEALQPP